MKIGHKDEMDKKILGRIASLFGVRSVFLVLLVQRCLLAPFDGGVEREGRQYSALYGHRDAQAVRAPGSYLSEQLGADLPTAWIVIRWF
jgi:hypothetical protein